MVKVVMKKTLKVLLTAYHLKGLRMFKLERSNKELTWQHGLLHYARR